MLQEIFRTLHFRISHEECISGSMLIAPVFFVILRAFKLDEDSALLTYVRQQLLPPSPRSPLVVSQDGVEEMNYQRNVRKVVHKISCSSSLLKLLVEVGSKVGSKNDIKNSLSCNTSMKNNVRELVDG